VTEPDWERLTDADIYGTGLSAPLEPFPELDPEPDIPLWGDVASFLENGIPDPPRPVALRREDGHALFYAAKVNVLFGDPESGKSWIAYAAVAQVLAEGRRAAILDVDHNGLREVVTRLLALGAPKARLADPAVFRYYEPEDGDMLIRSVFDARSWRPAVAVVDSLGEVMPMLGLSSNSPDEYTSGHRRVLSALAVAGAAVIAVDHMPKSEEARQHGQTGTLAKRRAVNGASYRVTVHQTFAPGKGGAASLTVQKDRPGGVRAVCPIDGRYQPAGRFVMTALDDGTLTWKVTAPVLGEHRQDDDGDLAELDALDPPPKSVRDVKDRLGWGTGRSSTSLAAWRQLRGTRGAES
jgi:hypothetical protein